MYIQFPKQRIPHFVQVTKHNVLSYGTNTASSVAVLGDEIDKEKKCRKQQIKPSVYGSLLDLPPVWKMVVLTNLGQVLPSLCPLFCKNQPVICSAKHHLFNTRQLIRSWPCDGEVSVSCRPGHCTSIPTLHQHSATAQSFHPIPELQPSETPIAVGGSRGSGWSPLFFFAKPEGVGWDRG